MDPKKASSYIKPVAEKLGVSEDLVSSVTNFYWKQVRRALNELQGPSIVVANFGSFNVKPIVVDKLCEKYRKLTENLDTDSMTFKRHSIYNIGLERLEKMKKIREEIRSEKLRKTEIIQKRIEYVTNKDMEREG